MVNQGIIKTTSFHSIIGSNSVLKPQGEHEKRSIVAELLLTALIDAFSILVIFLLMSFSSSGDILYVKNMELPKSIAAEELTRQSLVKIENGQLSLDGKILSQDQLLNSLVELKKSLVAAHPSDETLNSGLTVQADRRLKYETLNGIVLAASQAGFSDIKFAVVVN